MHRLQIRAKKIADASARAHLATCQAGRQQLFEPLGMKDIFSHPAEEHLPRVATTYHRDGGALTKVDQQTRLANMTYFSGAGGLMTHAEDYLQFGQMLLNGGP